VTEDEIKTICEVVKQELKTTKPIRQTKQTTTAQTALKMTTTSDKKMEFSKVLAILAFSLASILSLLGAYSWFVYKTIPEEFIQLVLILIGISFPAYSIKAGFDNHVKIPLIYESADENEA
jgi:hypothetical protein